MMGKDLEYEVVITDKDGKTILRLKEPARSFLKAYSQIIFSYMSRVPQSIKDTGGVNRAISFGGAAPLFYAGAGNVNEGIRFGTGNTPIDISDFTLQSPIAQGTGAGQLDHLGCYATVPTVDGTESAFKLTRTGINKSAANIAVSEFGVYGHAYEGSNWRYFCIVRDVLGSPVMIPPGGAITVTYSFKAVE
ncbi:MAG: hypothetical protein HYX80_01850 [Chloroflexi bacterium]|nr:hypothetical protein [Chloroflexota bacterium]